MNSIKRLRELEAAATPGPWDIRTPNRDTGGDATYKVFPPGGDEWSYFMCDEGYYNTAPRKPDAEFMAAMRNSLPKLIAIAEIAEMIITHEDYGGLRAGYRARLEQALAALEKV